MPLHRTRPCSIVAPLAILLTSACLFLAACGGSATGGASVNAQATDFSYKLDHTTASGGKVHVTLKNNSTTYQHELWLYPQNQPKLKDLLAAKAAGQDASEQDYLQNVAGKIEDLDPGKTASFDAMLQPGTYEFACFIVSNIAGKQTVHYDLGMHGQLTVH
jgi:uncharacterized cupredoxin-like copper-binding protein